MHKVLHINTNTQGGAAKAAIRQHLALLNSGVTSNMLFLYGDCTNIPYSFALNPENSFIKRVGRRLGIYRNQHDKNETLKKSIKGKYEYVSFPWSDFRLEKLQQVKDADLINLHWVSNFLDYPSFFENIKKPIVWTLHDMNPFLGLYHYTIDEESDIRNSLLNNHIKAIKFGAISKAQKLSFICPSKWMLNEFNKSDLCKLPAFHISNSVNTNVFRLHNYKDARRELEIPNGKKVLLFVSDNVHNRRKGFDLLRNALLNLDCTNILLCAIGSVENEVEQFKQSIRVVGRIEDEKTLAKYYAAADAFILPSRQDNLPNVMLESLACGTPVISFNEGGMKDYIQDRKNGRLAKTMNESGLIEAINDFLNHGVDWNRDEIRNFALEKFTFEKQVTRLIDVYNFSI